MDTKDIHSGCTSVLVLVLDEDGKECHMRMRAVLLEMRLSSSEKKTDNDREHASEELEERDGKLVLTGVDYVPLEATGEPGLDSLQPLSRWIICELTDDADKRDDYDRENENPLQRYQRQLMALDGVR